MTVGLETIKGWIINRLPGRSADESTVSEVCGHTGRARATPWLSFATWPGPELRDGARGDQREGVSLEDPEMLSSHLWKSLEAEGLVSDTPPHRHLFESHRGGSRCPDISTGPIDRTKDNYNTLKLLRNRGVLDNLCTITTAC